MAQLTLDETVGGALGTPSKRLVQAALLAPGLYARPYALQRAEDRRA